MIKLKHKNLEAWKLSIELTTSIYKLTSLLPKSEVYGLVSQLRRAAVSVPSNIAEGCSRSSINDRKRFFEIARSSLVEIDTQLEITLSMGYFNIHQLERIDELMNHNFAVISNLIKNTR